MKKRKVSTNLIMIIKHLTINKFMKETELSKKLDGTYRRKKLREYYKTLKEMDFPIYRKKINEEVIYYIDSARKVREKENMSVVS